MSVRQPKRCNIEASWNMELDTTRLIRSLIYTLAMGLVTTVVVLEGATELNVAIGIFYILGALLVFGVDIQRIELGPLKIKFQNDE
jgi:hypothetical protein